MTYSIMIEHSKSLSDKEACELLYSWWKILELLREAAYLKPGTNRRSSNDPSNSAWKQNVFYLISSCKEVIEYWRHQNTSNDQIAP